MRMQLAKQFKRSRRGKLLAAAVVARYHAETLPQQAVEATPRARRAETKARAAKQLARQQIAVARGQTHSVRQLRETIIREPCAS